MWNWEKIEEFYRMVLNTGRYNVHCHGMLALVARLREHPQFAGVEPSLAHLTLRVGLPGYRRTIHVNCEQPDQYSIHLDFCKGEFYGEYLPVTSTDVIPALISYLHILQREKQHV
jgi:hypothetical protein